MIAKFGELGIDLTSLIIFLVNFGILLALLYILAYKPVLRMLDQRSERIKESMEQADAIKKQLAETEQQVQAHLEKARQEGQAIVARAAEAGERLKEEARQEARRQAEILLARARAEIQAERDEAVAELRRQFVDLAVLAAERVIRQSLDREAHRRLIEETLEESITPKGG